MWLSRLKTMQERVLGINKRNAGVIARENRRADLDYADDKDLTKTVLTSNGITVPRTIGVVGTTAEINAAVDLLKSLKSFVLKPTRGRKGYGILVLKTVDKGWQTPSGKMYDETVIKRFIANIILGSQGHASTDSVLIEELIVCDEFFGEFYSNGLSDIRIITLRNKIVDVMARIPTDESGGRANISQGAIGISLNVQNGEMLGAYRYGEYMSDHPDSGVRIVGKIVPFWSKIVDMAVATSKVVPLKFLGIDIVIDRVKGPLVMEINARPGLEIQNVNKRGLQTSMNNARK